MKPERDNIALIGSGLTGPLLAISLAQRGFPVQLYERRPDMRRVRISAGRSINLALSTRGIHALREAGLWGEIASILIPMRGRMMHSVTGELTFMPYGKDETEFINSVSRAELNIALMNAAEKAGVSIRFNERCVRFDLRSGAIHLRNEDTGVESVVDSRIVIGTDGATSAVRTEMLKLSRFNFSQQYLDYGYKELTIPAGTDGRHVFETYALHIWPRGTFMLIALPNIDGTFGCILFLPFEGGDISFEALDSEAKILSFFEVQFPDALRLMPNLIENYFGNPTGAMVTVKCSPWHVGGKALLLGDAAHAIVPFFGQGMNCAFEDCTYFLELLDRHGSDWPVLFSEFEKARKADTDAIADLAIENFVEMRDRVADPRFLFRKKVEIELEKKYPGRFVPKYAMVTFHRTPYSIAAQRGAVQDCMLGELCDSVQRLEDIDWTKAEALVQQKLTPLPGVV
jgi:kynurenine 3-monooxygenase